MNVSRICDFSGKSFTGVDLRCQTLRGKVDLKA